jgi:glyoxylate reductase
MARVLLTTPLPEGSLDPLTDAGHEIVPLQGDLQSSVAGVDAVMSLLTDQIDRAVLAAARGTVQVVANVAVGYNNIDVAAAREMGIVVCNTPGVLDETTADVAFLLVLAAARLASEAESDLRAGRWPGWGIDQYLGVDVHGATIGVVGWGRIGQALARRAGGFGMTVLHHARTDRGDAGFVADLDELLERSDVVSLHVPYSTETHHLIDAHRLDLIGPHGVLVNTARGPVVDEAALADALHGGRLFAAGLDVFEAEPEVHPRLLSAPRTVLLPHIGSASRTTRVAMGRLAAQAVVDVFAGRTPPNLVL